MAKYATIFYLVNDDFVDVSVDFDGDRVEYANALTSSNFRSYVAADPDKHSLIVNMENVTKVEFWEVNDENQT